MDKRICNVRFTPDSGHSLVQLECPLCAKSCREQVQQKSAIERVLRPPRETDLLTFRNCISAPETLTAVEPLFAKNHEPFYSRVLKLD
jgi:hypothetical protein